MRHGFKAGLMILALALGSAGAMATQTLDMRGLEYSSPSGAYLAGRYAAKVHDTEYAAAFFARALDEDPGNPILIERAFLLDLSAGNMNRAAELAGQIAKTNPRHRLAQLMLGVKSLREGHWSDARKFLANTAFTPIGELSSSLLTAWSYAAEGKYDEAEKALKFLDKNTSLANFRLFHKALIADMLGRRDDADKNFAKTYDAAGPSLRVVQAYGNYLERSGGRKKAIQIYQTFLDKTQRNPLVVAALEGAKKGVRPDPLIADANAGVAEALFGIASALTDEQSIDIALIYDQIALWIRPDYPVAQMLQGEIYEDVKRYENAVEAFRSLPQTSPLMPSAQLRIANDLDDLGRTDDAIAGLDKLIAKEPNNYDALYTRGNIQRAHERWAEAADSYTRALARIPSPGKRHWTVYYFRGIAYERSDQWPKAEADFKKALQLRPDQPAVLNYLGYSWIEKGMNLDKALAMVKKAVDLRPNDGYIVDSLGWAYYHLGNYAEATKYLERAVQLRPEDATINEHLGDAYWRVGRKLEAKFQWAHARDSKPDAKELKGILKKLSDGLPPPKQFKPADNGKAPDRT